ncbi:hypothetical protein LAV79_15330 [Peribacillus butanolivorans]|uniref:hypothetical protein n=1 Tax=Peribacillus butanolivorans TaxID=421767 RepID=UPI0030CA1173
MTIMMKAAAATTIMMKAAATIMNDIMNENHVPLLLPIHVLLALEENSAIVFRLQELALKAM